MNPAEAVKRRLVGVVSEFQTFADSAWDSYAKGALMSSKVPFLPVQGLCRLSAEFDKIRNGQTGQEIRNCLTRDGAQQFETEPRFTRRVLDVYLMKRGGRTNLA